MPNIVLNRDVWDKYLSGYTLDDAISDTFSDEIKARIEDNEKFKELTPLQMVMHDAGIKRGSTLDSIMSMSVNDSAYTSGGMDTNKWLFPAWVETSLREALYDTDYLPYLVTSRIGVDTNTVQAATLDLTSDENKRSIKKARIAEGADIPTGKIVIGERAITLWKRGRAIEFTYEAARRMRIKLFQRQMRAIASDLAHQEIEAAVDVLVNGDGNKNTAAEKILTTATADTIKADEVIDALIEYSFANHFNATTMTVPKKYLKQLGLMMYDRQLAMGASMQVTFNIPQMNSNNITLIGVPELKIGGKDALVLSNKDLSLTRYEENGSNIQEMDTFIRNQTKLMTLTENSGYALNLFGSNMYIEIKSA